MRDYGKVHTRFWTSDTIRALGEDARTLALYLMTCPHSTIAGVFRLPDGYACEDLKWSPERVAAAFVETAREGFANRCETTKWVWVVAHLDWNEPENPNQRKAAAKCARAIPDNCAWKADFLRTSGDSLGLVAPAAPNPSATLPEPSPNQEQEQEQEQEKSNPSDEGSAKPPPGGVRPIDPCPHSEIVDAYHAKLPMLRRVRDWTPDRQALLRARWRERPERQTVAWWEGFFAYIAQSDFLTGRTEGRGGRPFDCDLEWIVRPKNFRKIVEGKYENTGRAA